MPDPAPWLLLFVASARGAPILCRTVRRTGRRGVQKSYKRVYMNLGMQKLAEPQALQQETVFHPPPVLRFS